MMIATFGIKLFKVKRCRSYRALAQYTNSISQGFVTLHPVLLRIGALPLLILNLVYQSIIQ